ncbi:hypothetical protein HCDG_07473 [Histoplasma capsulatum H143]|uniref:Uncharacterized protein n=1 Tax=Ajellomyces capsulatus (strain H143) TaxID=544712 RepID=C6HN07_AJECH|nr:hypothetical protein HCDG_07473 [Histoplasma capsulatum H143]
MSKIRASTASGRAILRRHTKTLLNFFRRSIQPLRLRWEKSCNNLTRRSCCHVFRAVDSARTAHHPLLVEVDLAQDVPGPQKPLSRRPGPRIPIDPGPEPEETTMHGSYDSSTAILQLALYQAFIPASAGHQGSRERIVSVVVRCLRPGVKEWLKKATHDGQPGNDQEREGLKAHLLRITDYQGQNNKQKDELIKIVKQLGGRYIT